MKVGDRFFRSIWPAANGRDVEIIDQTKLPHRFEIVTLRSLAEAATAIRDMLVRGAPLIGATAAYGFYLGLLEGSSDAEMSRIGETLIRCRPTAVNLRWAVDRMLDKLAAIPEEQRAALAYREAAAICEEDVATNESLGTHGAAIIRDIWERKGGKEPVNILTHCNAGWLATVDWGTALAPVFKAF
ncbi:MAG: S-methyl-5-thioribose-1-phosphate isomerase, partial [Desulfobulbaceae bacterium]|nr:S-methyl-5-thioribose-1-phosphate isomerase [Desulfobulbaceae bacterium]